MILENLQEDLIVEECVRHVDMERRFDSIEKSLVRLIDELNAMKHVDSQTAIEFARTVGVIDGLERRMTVHEKGSDVIHQRLDTKIDVSYNKLEGKVDNLCRKVDDLRAEQNKLTGKVGVWAAILLLVAANAIQVLWGV